MAEFKLKRIRAATSASDAANFFDGVIPANPGANDPHEAEKFPQREAWNKLSVEYAEKIKADKFDLKAMTADMQKEPDFDKFLEKRFELRKAAIAKINTLKVSDLEKLEMYEKLNDALDHASLAREDRDKVHKHEFHFNGNAAEHRAESNELLAELATEIRVLERTNGTAMPTVKQASVTLPSGPQANLPDLRAALTRAQGPNTGNGVA